MFSRVSRTLRADKQRQSGRAHIEIVVLLTCIGTLAIITSPGQTDNPPVVTDSPQIVDAAQAVSDQRPDVTVVSAPATHSRIKTAAADSSTN